MRNTTHDKAKNNGAVSSMIRDYRANPFVRVYIQSTSCGDWTSNGYATQIRGDVGHLAISAGLIKLLRRKVSQPDIDSQINPHRTT